MEREAAEFKYILTEAAFSLLARATMAWVSVNAVFVLEFVFLLP